MRNASYLYSRLYIHYTGELSDLNKIIIDQFAGRLDQAIIMIDLITIQTMPNKEYNSSLICDLQDGFLHYKYTAEIWSEAAEKKKFEQLLADMLKYLWSINIPVVASYNDDENLPENGGYLSLNVPRPFQ